MKNYLFEIVGEYSELCGETFFVQADNREKANEVLAEYFEGERIRFLGVYSDAEAEMMGYDTY